MVRMPVAARREQLVAAAMLVASRDGIEAATVRAIAAQAGVSLGVVHYCFEDKNELLLAMAHDITRQNLDQGLMQVQPGAEPAEIVEQAIDSLWAGISATAGAQLLSYELTTHSMRHPELRQVSVEQYTVSHAAARQFLEAVAAVSQIEWTLPIEQLARLVVMATDGITLAWLADGDDEAAVKTLHSFGGFLISQSRSAPDQPAVAALDDAVEPVAR
jgi:AcrR family transcriptional regulator